jgi:hypothetical protein
MAILASREHTCIHKKVSESTDKTGDCRKLIKDEGCKFYDKLKEKNVEDEVSSCGENEDPIQLEKFEQHAWDIEDLVTNCKKQMVYNHIRQFIRHKISFYF